MNTIHKNETKSAWYLKCLAAFILTFGAFFAKYPHYVLHPNNQTFFSNGDLLVTLHDMIYHVRYDKNGTFSGMNYPEGEYIFMTDANGSFATLFRWIDTYLFDIDTILPGILMSTIFLLLGMCGMFIFMMLRTSKVSTPLALVLAPIITLLSPQMVRIACHLSLSFPFVIPMVMLWTLRKFRVPRFEIWDLVFAFVTFFFFMNNAYIGFIMCMFAGLIGFVLWWKGRKTKEHHTAAYIMMATPVVITIIVYILLKINDPYSDRLEEQWGFFHYHTRLHSLFYPKYSLLSSWIPKYQGTDKRSIEWTNNLGLIPMGLIISYWIYNIRKKYTKSKELLPLLKKDTMMSVFLWASFFMFLFAANTVIFPIKNIIESYMGPLLMFKSSGRFSWPLYFVIALFAAKILQAWSDRLSSKNINYQYFLLVPLILFYAYEANHYLDARFTGKDRKNYLTAPQSEDISKVLQQAEINTDNYQAMFLLPLFVGWNEKLRAGVYNRTEEGGLTVSSLTGIPMINGRLSRNSTSKTLQATQVSSHPILKKEVLDLMPNDKPILLVQGTNIKKRLSKGENALKDLGTLVFETKKYIGYLVTIDQIMKHRSGLVAETLAHYQMMSDSLDTPLVHKSYDDLHSDVALFGKGAFTSKIGKQKILDLKKNFDTPDTLKYTIWSEITSEKYGMPEFIITVKGPNKHYQRMVKYAREHKDIYKNWIRTEVIFPVPQGENHIEVVLKGNQPFHLDELQLSYEKETIAKELENGTILWNNYPVIPD